jgi:hypothetical protein
MDVRILQGVPRVRAATPLILLSGLLVLGLAGLPRPADGQVDPPENYSQLGFSAAPDAYVATLLVQPGEPFTLYVIATGPGGGALPFDVASAVWGVYAVCCGEDAEILGFSPTDGMSCSGEPLTGVNAAMSGCRDEDILTLAAVTMRFLSELPLTYIMRAGAFGPVVDCLGENHLLLGLDVEVTVDGDVTPREQTTWGKLKASYNGDARQAP